MKKLILPLIGIGLLGLAFYTHAQNTTITYSFQIKNCTAFAITSLSNSFNGGIDANTPISPGFGKFVIMTDPSGKGGTFTVSNNTGLSFSANISPTNICNVSNQSIITNKKIQCFVAVWHPTGNNTTQGAIEINDGTGQC